MTSLESFERVLSLIFRKLVDSHTGLLAFTI